MNIRLLTFHAAANYGAALQAYALQEYIRSLGHEVSFIDYQPSYLTTGGSFHIPKDKWSLEANLVIAYQKLNALKNLKPGMRMQISRFAEFQKQYLSIKGQRYGHFKQLLENPPPGDIFIAGSDQIWNPSKQQGLDKTFFLGFAQTGLRASYGASFGRSVIPERHHTALREGIRHLHHVSVREKSGQTILHDLAKVPSTLVPDPTFLIDWNKEKQLQDKNEPEEDKVFFYVLRDGTGVHDLQWLLSEKKKLRIIQPYNPHQRWKTHGEVLPMGPWEWLREIQRSKYVITNSFHGTVFAVLFGKHFANIKLPDLKSSYNERSDHLLTSLGLKHHSTCIRNIDQILEITSVSCRTPELDRSIQSLRMLGRNFINTLMESGRA